MLCLNPRRIFLLRNDTLDTKVRVSTLHLIILAVVVALVLKHMVEICQCRKNQLNLAIETRSYYVLPIEDEELYMHSEFGPFWPYLTF